MTERLPFHFSLSCIGKGNGNPLQCSCLENPRDGGAWWAAIYGITQSWTWLKRLSSSSIFPSGHTVGTAAGLMAGNTRCLLKWQATCFFCPHFEQTIWQRYTCDYVSVPALMTLLRMCTVLLAGGSLPCCFWGNNWPRWKAPCGKALEVALRTREGPLASDLYKFQLASSKTKNFSVLQSQES